MKLLMIGNSHAAMVADALSQGGGDGLDVTFFAQAGRGPVGAAFDGAKITAEDPKLRAALDTLGMPETVTLTDYDAIVLVGMTTSVFSAVPLTQKHRILEWKPDPLAAPWRTPVSQALVAETLRHSVLDGQAMRYVRHIRGVTDCPIRLLPQPLPSEDILTHPKWGAFKNTAKWGEGAFHAQAVTQAIAAAFGDFSALECLVQPASTVAQGFLTKSKFRKGAKRLNIKYVQEEDDVLHANAAMGKLMLAALQSSLS